MERLTHRPNRVRTAQSGACSHCVARRGRCYIGVRGVPCSTCRRLNLQCDSTAILPKLQATKRTSSPIYCDEETFKFQIHRTVQDQEYRSQKSSDCLVAATDPLENYITIANQLLGPEPLTSPFLVNIPGDVSGLPSRLDQGSQGCQSTKETLNVPTTRFRNALLKSYMLWVHPQMPILDMESFLFAITKNDSHDSIRPLLYHAVMFAACAFVDISYIHHEGYTSREAARDALFQRVKALLNVSCEDERLTTVQALILLIHWNDEPHHDEDTSHSINTCLSMAMSIGLHCSPESSSLTLSEQKTWRRTWWALYNYFRLTAGDVPSVMLIQNDHTDGKLVDMPMITLNDFQFGIFAPETRAIVDGCDVLHSVDLQKTQALLFIEKTRLCRLSQYSSISNRVSNLVLGIDRPESCSSSQTSFANAEKTEELHRWFLQLPATACHQCPSGLTQTEWDRSVYLHRAWLRLLYLGSLYAACFDQLQEVSGTPPYPLRCPQSDQADQCLVDITDLFDEVDSLGLSRHLPSSATALLVLVLTYHKRPLGTIMSLVIQAKRARCLHKCWNMLHELEETSRMARCMIAAVKNSACDDMWQQLSVELLT